jgi:hypothetical protein
MRVGYLSAVVVIALGLLRQAHAQGDLAEKLSISRDPGTGLVTIT